MKTVLEDLLEKYPNVRLGKTGIPDLICPDNLDKDNMSLCDDLELTPELCISCWNCENKHYSKK